MTGVSLTTMQKYWPNVRAATTSASYSSFWSHEWTTHGTCSGLDQATYFKTAVNLLINDPTPSFVGANYGKTVTKSALQQAYGGPDQVVLQCSGKYLRQVLTCWTKGAGNMPTGRRACPTNLLNKPGCGTSIMIAPF